MRSSTTRALVLIIAVIMTGIIGLQVHWLQKTYAFEKNEFTTAVIKSIRGLYEDIDLSNASGSHLRSLIEQPDPNSFIFRIDSVPARDSLLFYLKNEFDDFDIYTDCMVTVYNGNSNNAAYELYLPASGITQVSNKRNAIVNPISGQHCILLYFPNRAGYIISQMNRWIVTSVFLLALLISFSFAVYYLFKQKFLNEIQKDFINNVTHEFSTPLTVIDLSTNALMKPPTWTQPDKLTKYAGTIRHQSDYLKRHIRHLVHTVVAEHYNFAVSKSAISPNELIRQCIVQLDPILQEKKGKVHTTLEPDDQVIEADHENLYLAIFNILSNALKYSDRPEVKINTALQSNQFLITISDNGIGIEPRDLRNIFKKFYRAQKGNLHHAKGLGLGLYFAKKIIGLHNGKITVDSKPGIGTEFRIHLPTK